MSWAKVFKINKNMKRSLDEQLQDMKFQQIRVITANTTYTPEKTGLYKVICVGKGGDGYIPNSGGAYGAIGGGGGGVAIKTMRLESTKSYNVTASSTTASFADIISATPGSQGSRTSSGIFGGVGGSGTGGDYNYTGETGGAKSLDGTMYKSAKGGSVGVVISDLSRLVSYTTTLGTFHQYGEGLLGYGGGAAATGLRYSSSGEYIEDYGQPAAVLIIPIEMEE